MDSGDEGEDVDAGRAVLLGWRRCRNGEWAKGFWRASTAWAAVQYSMTEERDRLNVQTLTKS